MKAYILRVLAVSMLTALCNLFLPDGQVRRFAAPMLGLAVTASILVPAAALFKADIAADALLPAAEIVPDTETYVRRVEEEYTKRIADEIAARGDVTASVSLREDFTVSRIVLTGDVNTAVMQYITMELEVPRSHVEIR